MDLARLDPGTGELVLQSYAARNIGDRKLEVESDKDLCSSLLKLFDIESVENSSPADLTAATLTLVSKEMPDLAQELTYLSEDRAIKERAIDPLTLVTLSTATIFVLQTYIEFERRPDGTWSLKIKKRPTDSSLIKSVIKKLAGLPG